MGEHEQELSSEQLVEQIRRLKVEDVLLSTLATVAQLGYAKLEPSSRDLDQARLAIESLRAVVGVLEGAAPAATIRDFNQVVANLQLAYAAAAAASQAEPGAAGRSGEDVRAPEGGEGEEGQKGEEGAETPTRGGE